MDKIIVVPLAKVGSLSFGLSRDDVRHIFSNYSEFRKSPMSVNSTDDLGFCHVYYDKDNKVEAVELLPGCEAEIGGRVVFPGTINNAIAVLGEFEDKDGCIINVEKSVGITAQKNIIESILFGKEGYYNELLKA